MNGRAGNPRDVHMMVPMAASVGISEIRGTSVGRSGCSSKHLPLELRPEVHVKLVVYVELLHEVRAADPALLRLHHHLGGVAGLFVELHGHLAGSGWGETRSCSAV